MEGCPTLKISNSFLLLFLPSIAQCQLDEKKKIEEQPNVFVSCGGGKKL